MMYALNRQILSLTAVLIGAAGAVGVMGVVDIATAQTQILEIHSDSLTTYQAGVTALHGVKPLHSQRGVNLDGGLRAGPFFAWAVAGNPFEGGDHGHRRVGHIDLATGSVVIADVDWAGANPGGVAWPIGRTFNQVQAAPTDKVQGLNWFQSSQPEIVLYDADSDPEVLETEDTLYLVYGADRYLEFDRTDDNATTFKAKNGGAGVFEYVAGSPDTYIYYDQNGTRTYFFGGNTSSSRANWQIWKVVDVAGNTSYVGDATTASTAATSGYNTDKTIAVAYDAAPNDGRRYTYSYTTVNSVSRLSEVKVETKTGGTWSSPSGLAEVARVSYDYYTTTDNDKGKAGYLRMVTVRTTLSDSGSSLGSGIYFETKRYYRYYTRTWDDSDGRRGNEGDIKMIVDREGCRNFDWGENGTESPEALDDGFLTASDSELKPYSSAYFEYPSADHRPSKAFFNGECGCSGGINGMHEFTYATNSAFSPVSGYDTEWYSRAVVKRPDGTYMTQYFDETGQTLSTVITNTDPGGSPTQTWATEVVRNSSGQLIEVHSPANISAYTHTNGSVAFTSSSSAGLITYFDRTASGDMVGFSEATYIKKGTSGTVEYVGYSAYTSTDYEVDTGVEVIRPLLYKSRVYHTSGSSAGTAANYNETAFSYAVWGVGNKDIQHLAMKKATTSLPAVPTGENGKNQSVLVERYIRLDQTTAFSRDPVHSDEAGSTLIVGYTELDEYGRSVRRISDKKHESDWSGAGYPPADNPSNWGVTLESSGKDIKTTQSATYDAQGRPSTSVVQDISGTHTTAMYYSRLADGRMVTVSIPKIVAGSPDTFYGPCSYTITNHAGRAEFAGTIVLSGGTSTTALSSWIDESDYDPITALDVGSLFRVSTSVYGKSGTQVEQSRVYHSVPASGAGSSGTNYDATKFGYDSMGRRTRVKDSTGTITLMSFDTLGRTTKREVGTNDADEAGTDNMVEVERLEYDGNIAGGNSHLTKRTLDPDGDWDNTGTGSHPADDRRITEYTYDYRGRLLLTTNPLAPHVLNKFDNMNRVIASAGYSSAPASTENPTSYATGRVTLAQTFYDTQGRVWKTQRHNITQSNGADADNLQSLTWYSAEGRVLKSKGEGRISKTAFDRLGRATNRFVISADNDTAYTDVDDVAGDTVIEEHQTYFKDTTGQALMSVAISRFHDDTSGTGALDTDTDLSLLDWSGSKIKGRVQISTTFYDWMGRVTDTVARGTNAETNYDRDSDSSAPAGSSTLLRSTFAYNDNATLLSVTDPRAKVTRHLYDAAGRKTAEIKNYTGGSTTTLNRDNDLYTRYQYSNGQMIKLWVDQLADDTDGIAPTTFTGDDAADQVTVYTYGTPKGTTYPDSKIATGNLLYQVTYMDSGVVTYGYNALQEKTYTDDQNGTEIEEVFDAAGRLSKRVVQALGTNINGDVRRVEMAYASRGMVDTVTQYSATSGGTALDQVQYTYDGWGNLTKFEQDVDGVIGAGGRAAFSVQHAYTKRTPTNAAPAIARSSTTLPGSGGWSTVTYDYGSATVDDQLSRVAALKNNTTTMVSYQYLGAGQVVSTKLNEPNLTRSLYASGSPNAYAYMDRFNRVTRDLWQNGYHDLTLTYDETSNITSIDDQSDPLEAARDWKYTNDNLNRLSAADRGTLSGSSITGTTRREEWTLDQLGNWNQYTTDSNAASPWDTTDNRTHNAVNELTARSTPSATLAYDDAGQMTDDGSAYKYVYDAFGRLVTVKNQSSVAVATHRYNGVGYRIAWKYDTDADADVDANDKTFYFLYDERWRVAATFREDDAAPKEVFVHHAAGVGGFGGSSYVDSLVCRERDASTSWTAAADPLDERRYVGQNWRADVSVVWNTTGSVIEWMRYTPYGEAVTLPWINADFDRSGGAPDSADEDAFYAAWNLGDPSADVNRSGGTPDNADVVAFFEAWNNADAPIDGVGGYSGIRAGYAGYQWDPSANAYHVRNRVYRADLGRWTRRDPAGYVSDFITLFQYVDSDPLSSTDPTGLITQYVPELGDRSANAGASSNPSQQAHFDITNALPNAMVRLLTSATVVVSMSSSMWASAGDDFLSVIGQSQVSFKMNFGTPLNKRIRVAITLPGTLSSFRYQLYQIRCQNHKPFYLPVIDEHHSHQNNAGRLRIDIDPRWVHGESSLSSTPKIIAEYIGATITVGISLTGEIGLEPGGVGVAGGITGAASISITPAIIDDLQAGLFIWKCRKLQPGETPRPDWSVPNCE